MRPFSIQPVDPIALNIFPEHTEASLEIVILEGSDDRVHRIDDSRLPIAEGVVYVTGLREFTAPDVSHHIGIELNVHARAKSD
jgi:hypothetical protein